MHLIKTAAQQINDARNQGYYLHISLAEMMFVCSSTSISDAEKLIWLNIAMLTAMDPNYACKLTYSQIAERVGKSENSIHRPVKNLKAEGFLQSVCDAKTRLTTYYLDLPKAGIDALAAAPKRGEKRNNSYTQPALTKTYPQLEVESIANKANLQDNPLQTCNDTPCKSATNTLADLQPLIISNNNKNKKHNMREDENHTECTSSNSPNTMPNANALLLKFYAKLESIRDAEPALTPLQANQKATQAFTSQERLDIHTSLVQEAKQQEQKIALTPIPQPQEPKPAPINQANRPQIFKPPTQLDGLIFGGEHFLVEPAVANKLFTEIPKLYGENKIQLKGPVRSQEVLLKEILYYIAKVKSVKEPKTQLNKYNIAKKCCLNGNYTATINLRP